MRFFFFLLVSLIIHILILANMNEFKVNREEQKQEVFHVDIVQKTPEVIPEEPEVLPEVTPVTPTETDAGVKGGTGSADRPSFAPVVSKTPQTHIKMPVISLPRSVTTQKYDIVMPKLTGARNNQPGRPDVDKDLVSQLDAQSAQYRKSVVDTTGAESIGADKTHSAQQSFFTIKSMGGNRKLIYIPDKPTFSLSASTNVRCSFKVDREGNTYSILLLNRTDSKIERLAIDFIQKLKFNAVLSDQSEPAEIILYFRVK